MLFFVLTDPSQFAFSFKLFSEFGSLILSGPQERDLDSEGTS
jgi:hypothetical protein